MNNHLTQDQMARSILGEAGAEEREHARNCIQCDAALREFREAVATFQSGMKEWSDLETVPALEHRPSAYGPWQVWIQPSLRWVLVGMAVVAVVILPMYGTREFESVAGGDLFEGDVAEVDLAEGKVNEDALLMEEVAAHLSRPLPTPMERVMVLLPTELVTPEREELR